MNEKARLDSDRPAKPLTRLVARISEGKRFMGEATHYEAADGQRVALGANDADARWEAITAGANRGHVGTCDDLPVPPLPALLPIIPPGEDDDALTCDACGEPETEDCCDECFDCGDPLCSCTCRARGECCDGYDPEIDGPT